MIAAARSRRTCGGCSRPYNRSMTPTPRRCRPPGRDLRPSWPIGCGQSSSFGAHAATTTRPATPRCDVRRMSRASRFARPRSRRVALDSRGTHGLATPLLIGRPNSRVLSMRFRSSSAPSSRSHRPHGGRTRSPACGRRRDLRRACEVQARSHLFHLREGYHRDRAAILPRSVRSSRLRPPLLALLTNLARSSSDAPTPARSRRLRRGYRARRRRYSPTCWPSWPIPRGERCRAPLPRLPRGG